MKLPGFGERRIAELVPDLGDLTVRTPPRLHSGGSDDTVTTSSPPGELVGVEIDPGLLAAIEKLSGEAPSRGNLVPEFSADVGKLVGLPQDSELDRLADFVRGELADDAPPSLPAGIRSDVALPAGLEIEATPLLAVASE